MVCLYENMIFSVSSTVKLIGKNRVKFIDYWEGSNEDYLIEYNKLYPNDSVRIDKVGKGIPDRVKRDIELEYSDEITTYNREREIDKLL